MKLGWTSKLVCAAVLLALGLSLAGCGKIRARGIIREANKNYKAGRYEEAINLYEASLKLDPGNTQILRSIAYSYVAMFRPNSTSLRDAEFAQGAVASLLHYLSYYPNDQKSANYLATIYIETEALDDAIAFFLRQHLAQPTDTVPIKQIAGLYAKRGDFDNSMKWYQQQLLREEGLVKGETLHMIGSLCWSRSYHQGRSIDPAQRLKAIDDGIAAEEQALEIRPDYRDALVYLNLLYREKEKVTDDPVQKQQYRILYEEYYQKALALSGKGKEATEAKPADETKPEDRPAETGSTPEGARLAGGLGGTTSQGGQDYV